MKTKEYDTAILHYNKSINFNPIESTTYCNRSLAFIRNKQYEKALEDCNKAIELKSDYSKAYYRRAQCYIAMSKMEPAFIDLLKILRETPKNGEILDEISILKSKWKTHIGKDNYTVIEAGIENDIDRIVHPEFFGESDDGVSFVNRGVSSNNKNSNPQNLNSTGNIREPTRVNVQHTETKNQEREKKTETETKKPGFKKIKIVEENPEDDVTMLEQKKTSEFFERVEKSRQEALALKKDGKLKEECDLNRKLLAECTNYLPEIGKYSNHLSNLENIINELNKSITEYSKIESGVRIKYFILIRKQVIR